jgi:hypothetical protein
MTTFAAMKTDLRQFGGVPVTLAEIASLFPDIKAARNKVARMERANELIRLRRDLYLVSPSAGGQEPPLGLIANHLNAPSYVSMQTALRHYGLIPEYVYAIKSMTTKRNCEYTNPMGRFKYVTCPADYFCLDVKTIQKGSFSFLIASPEKALCDLIVTTAKLRLRSMKATEEYLEADIRLDMDAFRKMNAKVFVDCAAHTNKKQEELMNVSKLLQP